MLGAVALGVCTQVVGSCEFLLCMLVQNWWRGIPGMHGMHGVVVCMGVACGTGCPGVVGSCGWC